MFYMIDTKILVSKFSYIDLNILLLSFRLVHWNLTDIPATFEPEGLSSQWCSYQTRQCHDCSQPSMSLEPWDLCSTRMMTPRLLVRLRKLQILANMQNISEY